MRRTQKRAGEDGSDDGINEEVFRHRRGRQNILQRKIIYHECFSSMQGATLNGRGGGRDGRAQASIRLNSEKDVWIFNVQLSGVPKIYSKVSSLSISYGAARQGVTLFRTRSPECGSCQLLDGVGYVDTPESR
jgi:hypothetical protein